MSPSPILNLFTLAKHIISSFPSSCERATSSLYDSITDTFLDILVDVSARCPANVTPQQLPPLSSQLSSLLQAALDGHVPKTKNFDRCVSWMSNFLLCILSSQTVAGRQDANDSLPSSLQNEIVEKRDLIRNRFSAKEEMADALQSEETAESEQLQSAERAFLLDCVPLLCKLGSRTCFLSLICPTAHSLDHFSIFVSSNISLFIFSLVIIVLSLYRLTSLYLPFHLRFRALLPTSTMTNLHLTRPFLYIYYLYRRDTIGNSRSVYYCTRKKW